MAKREAKMTGEPLKNVWPDYLIGPSRDPKPRPRRSLECLKREAKGYRMVLEFLERSFWIAKLGYVPKRKSS